MGDGPQPPAWLGKLAESYSQVQFGPGVMGKTSRTTIALIVGWGIIFFRLSGDIWQSAFLLAGGCIVTGAYIWWVIRSHKFAAEHPDIALLEGAQLIEYHKFEAQIKGFPPLKSPPSPDPHSPIEDKSRA